MAARLLKFPTEEEVLALQGPFRALAHRMRADVAGLKAHEPEDLVQEAFLKTFSVLDRYAGRSSFRTWASSVGKRHMLSLARKARVRKLDRTCPLEEEAVGEVRDPEADEALREQTVDLLRWLKKSPDGVEHGWEVLNLLLWRHGDRSKVALAMTLYTRRPWRERDVERVVEEIKETAKGAELCASLGIG